MKEITGNIFAIKDADAICVPTNGIVKSNGELVMGTGIAKQSRLGCGLCQGTGRMEEGGP